MGIRLAWRTKLLRGLTFAVLATTGMFAGGFFAFEQLVASGLSGVGPVERRRPGKRVERGPELPAIPLADDRPNLDRHHVWASLLCTFFRYPQALTVALVVGLIAPPLVARDVRSRAFMLSSPGP